MRKRKYDATAVLQHGQYAHDEIATAIREGHEYLATYGIKVGAVVHRPACEYYKASTYKIHHISNSPSEYFGFYLYGWKLRKNGTYGTHVHSMGAAHEFTPVRQK